MTDAELESWTLVAELTGLPLNQCANLLDAVGGDVQMAVQLHYEQPMQAQTLSLQGQHVDPNPDSPPPSRKAAGFAALFGDDDSDESEESDDEGEMSSGNEPNDKERKFVDGVESDNLSDIGYSDLSGLSDFDSEEEDGGTEEDSEVTADEIEDKLGDVQLTTGDSAAVSEAITDEEDGNNDEWVDGDDDEESNYDSPWEPRWTECLFDRKCSKTFEANIKYMWRRYSFFAPNAKCLKDPRGLFSYLQEKICRYKTCLYCNRSFYSVEACKSHMRDKSHCHVNYDDGGGAVELAEFYHQTPVKSTDDSAASAASEAESRPASETTTERGAVGSSALGELVLANGTKLGHRSLKQYYKQSFKNEPGHVRKYSKKDSKALQSKVALREENKRRNEILLRGSMFAKGNSKALSSTYIYKADAADNERARAIKHHWGAGGGGSHYHMAGSRQYQKGVRVKGVVLRHSRQGARLQAERNKKNRGNGSIAILR